MCLGNESSTQDHTIFAVSGTEMATTSVSQNLRMGVRVQIQTTDSSSRAIAEETRRKCGFVPSGC